ncbi:Protein of unknown function [Bacillus sp. OV322]|uniref:DUF3888 domain-containing protein n=1 Tax=Bacillus sp. OV322 TaxID=1882764 RepID=UPI0008EFFCCA|nr:DUF3888 domain-containing protein [Bacillus sp. OV322]SFC51259.1 Protein of unknown function [Bacillus sp. OV322]
MKHIIIGIVLSFSILGLTISTPIKAETEGDFLQEKHNDFYDAFLVFLNPYAQKAINKKYPTRNYALWNSDILEVKRMTGGYSQYDFKVKVKYDTYTGAHNPQEGPVIITFEVKTDKVTVVDIKG